MRRFHRSGIGVLSLLAAAALASPLFAVPFRYGSSDYFGTRINWQVFADFALRD